MVLTSTEVFDKVRIMWKWLAETVGMDKDLLKIALEGRKYLVETMMALPGSIRNSIADKSLG